MKQTKPHNSVTYLACTVQNFAQGLLPNQSSESLEEPYPVIALKRQKTTKPGLSENKVHTSSLSPNILDWQTFWKDIKEMSLNKRKFYQQYKTNILSSLSFSPQKHETGPHKSPLWIPEVLGYYLQIQILQFPQTLMLQTH